MTKPKDRWYHYYDGFRIPAARVVKALRHLADAVETSGIKRFSVHLTVAEPVPDTRKASSTRGGK